jgi:hypothetical protein
LSSQKQALVYKEREDDNSIEDTKAPDVAYK